MLQRFLANQDRTEPKHVKLRSILRCLGGELAFSRRNVRLVRILSPQLEPHGNASRDRGVFSCAETDTSRTPRNNANVRKVLRLRRSFRGGLTTRRASPTKSDRRPARSRLNPEVSVPNQRLPARFITTFNLTE